MTLATILAGLSWDPAMRGIAAVGVGVAVLMGSVYLLLATNTGYRLGFQIAAAGLFGWLTILTAVWWIQPPGIGPRGGVEPHWKPVEFVYNSKDPSTQAEPQTAVVTKLPSPYRLPDAAQITSELANATDIEKQVPSNPVLGDLQGAVVTATSGNAQGQKIPVKDILSGKVDGYIPDSEQVFAKVCPETDPNCTSLNNWKLIPTSDAGEAQTAADASLVAAGVFKDATEYKKLSVYEYGGNPTLEDDCPDAVDDNQKRLIPTDPLCRLVARVKKTFRLWHPPHYAVVQVQAVIPQTAKPGEAPPIPKVDPTKPIISVVLLRDQGNIRLKPAMFFLICSSLFTFFCLMLHFRDKNAMRNRQQKPDKAGA